MTSTALWRGVGTCLLAAASMGALVPGTGVDFSLATAKPKTSAPGLVAVLVEPSKLGSATGMQPVYAFVLSAKKSVDMTMYELSDPIMVNDLVADRRRGVKVRVVQIGRAHV